jgi:hypothetical protein
LAGYTIKSCAKAELAKKTAKSAKLTNCILCFVVIILLLSLSLNVSGNKLVRFAHNWNNGMME